MASYLSYFICTSPRSGSTLLCKMLAATGIAGKPDSHFHSPCVEDWMGYYDIVADVYSTERDLLAAIFHAAYQRGSSDKAGGIFGLRLQRQSFDFFTQKLQVLCPGMSSDVERVQQQFGNTLFIHLTRENKLDQAISCVKATQTGLWHKAPDGTELERLSPPQEPVYNADAIAKELAEFTAMDKDWNSWFARDGIQPLRISYDDLSAAPIKVCATILGHLGLQQEMAGKIALPVAKLADSVNLDWANRFNTDNN